METKKRSLSDVASSVYLKKGRRSGFVESGIVLIPNLLNPHEVAVLRLEADSLLSGHTSSDDADLAGNGCAFDPMEAVAGALPPHHPVRKDVDEYLRQRFRSPGPLSSLTADETSSESRQKQITSVDGELSHADEKIPVSTETPRHVQLEQQLPLEEFREILRGPLAKAAREILGTEGPVYLFNEHYVIKPASSEISFAWHTDENEQLAGMALPVNSSSRTAETEYPEYVSIWCALDDSYESNGGLELCPLNKFEEISKQSTSTGEPTSKRANPNACSKRTRAGAGAVAEVETGGAIVFSSRVSHRSGPNTTSSARRAYYAQFSARPILGRRSPSPLCFAVPLYP